MRRKEIAQTVRLISKAWGRQDGYAFFPTISGQAEDRGERIRSYKEGPAFHWPHDEQKIIQHLLRNSHNDVYWCPMLFEKPRRQAEFQMDEHALWADLDTVDPNSIDEALKPTIAWETSPGRYQAVWILQRAKLGASWPGNENQRLTHLLGADPSGWDTTQLLRLPGWPNYKPERRTKSGPAQGQLIWRNGPIFLGDEFDDLPEVAGAKALETALEGDVDEVDRHDAWARVRLRVSKRVRELIAVREVDDSADRSAILWEIERELADAGLRVAEIVAIIRHLPWNKYAGRADEIHRLVTEAAKAIAAKEEPRKDPESALEVIDEQDRGDFEFLDDAVKNVKQPVWMVKDILMQSAVGFVAGQPKSFKSWITLDLALSVATGAPFLGHFAIRRPGRVAIVQEEDPMGRVKKRQEIIRRSKSTDRIELSPNGDGPPDVVWHPPTANDRVNVLIACKRKIILSDPSWQAWLLERIEYHECQLLILDALSRMMGDVRDEQSTLNEKIFGPLDQIRERTGCAILIVHHMRKNQEGGGRGGQLMLGSTAYHQFSEDSMYVRRQKRGQVWIERECKDADPPHFQIQGLGQRGWRPQVIFDESRREPKIMKAIRELGSGWHTTEDIAKLADIERNSAWRQLKRCEELGLVVYYRDPKKETSGRWSPREKI